MKDTRRFFSLFTYYDKNGIERYLERKAVEGWMLEKMSAFGWRFRRIAPQKIHFSVNYFPKASAFDAEPGEQQLMFQDFCAHTGWKLADSAAQIQVFYNEAEDPVPIETDALMELETIHKSTKSSYLSSYFLQLALSVFQLGMLLYRYSIDPMNLLASNVNLISIFMWIVILFLDVSELWGYYRWRRRALAAAELTGSFTETKCRKSNQLISLALLFAALGALLLSYSGSRMLRVMLASFALVLSIIAVTLAITALLKRMKVSAKVNQFVTIGLAFALSISIIPVLGFSILRNGYNPLDGRVPADTYEFHGETFEIYRDPLPLTLEDLDKTITYDGYSCERYELDRSFIVSQTDYNQRPRYDGLENPDLAYTLTDVHIGALYNFCKAALIDDFDHNYAHDPTDPFWKSQISVDPAPWGAKEAYQLILGGEAQSRFLLCYETRMVEIDFDHDWQFTDEHKAIVGQYLGR